MGDMTDESRETIADFVKRTFVERLGDENRVAWFKNWVQLQSVRALEHIHVLVKDATKDDLEFWTGKKIEVGDIPTRYETRNCMM